MGEVLNGSFGGEKTFDEGTYRSHKEVEDQGGLIIENLLNKTLKHAQQTLTKPIDGPEFMSRTLLVEIEIEELLQDINIPPGEEDYIQGTQFKIALFKQKLEEGNFRERLIEALMKK